jgi:hypothetical protein
VNSIGVVRAPWASFILHVGPLLGDRALGERAPPTGTAPSTDEPAPEEQACSTLRGQDLWASVLWIEGEHGDAWDATELTMTGVVQEIDPGAPRPRASTGSSRACEASGVRPTLAHGCIANFRSNTRLCLGMNLACVPAGPGPVPA